MAGQVEGKVALVTGGSSGIGAAVAGLLAREGATVAVTDIDDLRGPEVVAGIKKAGHKAEFWHHDVTSEPRWVEVVADVEIVRRRLVGREDRVTSLQAIRRKDVTLLAIRVGDEREIGRAVRIVFDRLHLGREITDVPAEIDGTVKLLVTAAAMT